MGSYLDSRFKHIVKKFMRLGKLNTDFLYQGIIIFTCDNGIMVCFLKPYLLEIHTEIFIDEII